MVSDGAKTKQMECDSTVDVICKSGNYVGQSDDLALGLTYPIYDRRLAKTL